MAYGDSPFGSSAFGSTSGSAPVVDYYEVPAIDASPTVHAPTLVLTDEVFSLPVIQARPTLYAPSLTATDNNGFALPTIDATPALGTPYFTTRTDGSCLSVQLIIAGTDRTDKLASAVTVEEGENQSTLANFTLVAVDGLASRQSVVILADDGSSLQRLFTGVLSVHEIAVDSGDIQCRATNDLQGTLRAMSEAEIAALIDGWRHEVISGDAADGWQYAQQMLESVPAEIHIEHDGSLVRADWAAKATADVEITSADRYSSSARGTVAQLSTIVNRNQVTCQHAFKRRKLRTVNVNWLVTDFLSDGANRAAYQLPTEDAARSALDGTGWAYRGLSFTRPWEIGSGTYMGKSGGKHWVNYGDMQAPVYVGWEDSLICGFSARLSKTWDQTILNNRALDVKSPASITLNGERAVDETWVLQEEESVTEPAQQQGRGALVAKATGKPGATVINSSTVGGSALELENGKSLANGDWYYDDIANVADIAALIRTATARAEVEVLAAHRSHSETFEVPFSHAHRLGNTTRVVGSLTCKGKNRKLVHTIDPINATAVTTITVAISGLSGQGTDAATPLALDEPAVNDPLTNYGNITLNSHIGGQFTSPAKPDDENAFFSDYLWDYQTPYQTTYVETDTVETYGVGFRITPPEIGGSDVDDLEQTDSQEVIVAVPVDEYTITGVGACA